MLVILQAVSLKDNWQIPTFVWYQSLFLFSSRMDNWWMSHKKLIWLALFCATCPIILSLPWVTNYLFLDHSEVYFPKTQDVYFTVPTLCISSKIESLYPKVSVTSISWLLERSKSRGAIIPASLIFFMRQINFAFKRWLTFNRIRLLVGVCIIMDTFVE